MEQRKLPRDDPMLAGHDHFHEAIHGEQIMEPFGIDREVLGIPSRLDSDFPYAHRAEMKGVVTVIDQFTGLFAQSPRVESGPDQKMSI